MIRKNNSLEICEPGRPYASNPERNALSITLTLPIEQLEPLLKSWIRDCMNYGPSTDTSNPPKYLTRSEVAAILRISLVTLDKYRKLGIIPWLLMGGNVRFRSEDLDEAFKTIANIKHQRKNE